MDTEPGSVPGQKSVLQSIPDSVTTATAGAGLAIGGGIVAAMGKGVNMALRAIITYGRRNYMTKLEIPNTDLSYNW